MLYILTALKCEAAALSGLPGKIIITGAGGLCPDALKELDLTPQDKVLNIGISGSKRETGSAYIASSVSMEGKKKLYPDIALWQKLPVSELVTVTEVKKEMSDDLLYDMEGYLIAEWALKVIPPSSVCLLKIVSDSGKEFPSKQEITDLVRSHLTEIKVIAEHMSLEERPCGYTCLAEDVTEQLRLTEYMRNELCDLMHYARVSDKEDVLLGVIDGLRRSGRIPCKSKKEGRQILDEILSSLR